MASLEDIVASLTDRLRSLELETKPFNKELAPKVYVNQRPPCRTSLMDLAELPRIYKPVELVFSNYRTSVRYRPKEIATLEPCSRIKLYPGFLSGDRSSSKPSPFRRNQPPIHPFLEATLSSTNSDLLITTVDLQQINLLLRSLQLRPQHRTTDDMDIDFARRGPLTSSERQQRFSQGLYPNAKFRLSQWKTPISKFGKRSRPTLSRDLDSAVKTSPPEALRTDMMNMEDGNRLDICDRDDSARGMGVRGTEVYSCFCTLFPEKTLTSWHSPTGPLSHVDTFFVDCGADDLFMDSKLAADLQIPLLELSTPITLRLADGDSSSSLTHRNRSLQLHIGKHVETATFYVTDLCHGFILGYSWLERHNPRINWVSRMVEFDSLIAWKTDLMDLRVFRG
ncbi:hypothetical protein BASA83_008081 [Batrachochytrium salamandrivorans]|nr:hypothetical protein BASA83_008081 [Batrachochytrium salamandrivorans]